VNTAGAEDKRGLKLKKIRTESGKTVLAGPGKGEATGQLYKKWAKHNKQRIAATGAAQSSVLVWSWRLCSFYGCGLGLMQLLLEWEWGAVAAVAGTCACRHACLACCGNCYSDKGMCHNSKSNAYLHMITIATCRAAVIKSGGAWQQNQPAHLSAACRSSTLSTHERKLF
jgi:hypothetical protein